MIELRCDLLVVGAGPAGAALAATIAQRGADVVLVERARHPRPKACAEYASPRVVEELRRIGLGRDAWQPAAVPLRGMRVVVDGEGVDVTYADRRGPRPAWGLDRQAFDARLVTHARDCGATILEEHRFLNVLYEGGRVAGATIASPAGLMSVRAPWTVGADGARSTVSRSLGVEREVRFPRRLGLVAHYRGVPQLTDHGEMHVGDGYFIGLAPTPGGELNVGMALPAEPAGSGAARFDRAIAGLPAVAARLAHSERLTPIRGAAPIGHRVASVAGPGWLLVGDAAGFVDPFTGEGIYRALRTARAAANSLALADDRVAPAYRAERRRALVAKDTLTWVVQALLVAPPLLRHAVRRLAERPEAALRLGSALGDCRPATDALSPRFLASVLAP